MKNRPKRIIVKISVRAQWKHSFRVQFREACRNGFFIGYPRLLYPVKSRTKSHELKRKD